MHEVSVDRTQINETTLTFICSLAVGALLCLTEITYGYKFAYRYRRLHPHNNGPQTRRIRKRGGNPSGNLYYGDGKSVDILITPL